MKAAPLRVDPEQRFTCGSCARCCRRWEILVSPAEVASFRSRDAARWFREADGTSEGTTRDPFEAVPGWRGFHRIRKRDDGACGFLSTDNRCRLHEELGGGRKPLTCRMFPYSFHPAPDAVIVTASFGCPTVLANHGERIADGATLESIKALKSEWFAGRHHAAAPRLLVPGRSIEPASLGILRDGLLTMLNRADGGPRDLRLNVRRMALLLDDLTRTRVVRLADADFAEYVKLTVPYAAAADTAVPARATGWVGRLLQRGFLFVVAATRLRIEQAALSNFTIRLRMFRLLAHFHGLAPGFGRVNVAALSRKNGPAEAGRHINAHVDVNAPEIQPIVHHYLRASIQSLGAGERPLLDDLAIAVSYLNAACALAVMNARAEGRPVDRAVFSDALMEAVDLSHSDDRGLLGRALRRFAGGVGALHAFATQP